MFPSRTLFGVGGLLLSLCSVALANGGAWQVGVPLTGNAAPSDKAHSTNVSIGDENLTIDLHQEFAAVEVHYRMHNTGAKVQQDFFFPVERWTPEEGQSDEEGGTAADLENYRLIVDGAEVKWTDVAGPASKKASAEPSAEQAPGTAVESEAEDRVGSEGQDDSDLVPTIKQWKKSVIPFAANQTREVVVRYHAGYSGMERSVSDDSHGSDKGFAYSLSPAATWKGAIGHGKIAVNVLFPEAEQVKIVAPKERFKKVDERHYEWEFRELKPTLADDIKLVAHRSSDSYPVSYAERADDSARPEYYIEGDHYFLLHADFSAVASSTLAASGKHNYEIKNVRSMAPDHAWAEGAKGDGIGESITLEVTRPLPLAAIMIMPGYQSSENASLWEKNNRIAELEVTLNGEKTFTAKIPDEKFTENYPVLVPDYAPPVKTIKLVIKAVHPGSAAHDTCISAIRLKGKLTEKPTVHPAR